MNIDQFKADVEFQLEQALAIDWSNPKNLSPQGVANCNLMAVAKIMMKPENQMAMWRSMMDPRNQMAAWQRMMDAWTCIPQAKINAN
jgi:hypothetical protein